MFVGQSSEAASSHKYTKINRGKNGRYYQSAYGNASSDGSGAD